MVEVSGVAVVGGGEQVNDLLSLVAAHLDRNVTFESLLLPFRGLLSIDYSC